MKNIIRKTLTVAAVLSLGATACTDTTVEPKSTITEANVFNDAASYRAFLAKVYAGLAVTGRRRPDAAVRPQLRGAVPAGRRGVRRRDPG